MTDAPTPIPMRPSEADRERIAELLRASSVAGRISIDTLSQRVGRAYQADRSTELDALVADVRPAGLCAGRCCGPWKPGRGCRPTSKRRGSVRAWRYLPCPPAPKPSDCVVPEPSVSRRHAELRRDGARWLLRDLGSRNGTRVNGLRVLEETEVRPGDRVSLGEARYRLALR
jgi:hypothetical protein